MRKAVSRKPGKSKPKKSFGIPVKFISVGVIDFKSNLKGQIHWMENAKHSHSVHTHEFWLILNVSWCTWADLLQRQIMFLGYAEILVLCSEGRLCYEFLRGRCALCCCCGRLPLRQQHITMWAPAGWERITKRFGSASWCVYKVWWRNNFDKGKSA